MKTPTASLLAILASQIIWGFTTPALKIALDEIPPFSAVFIRFALASLLVLPILFFRKNQRVSRADLVSLVFVSLFGLSFHIGFLALGLNLTTVVTASLIIATAPILDLILASIFLKEEMSWVNKLGVYIGFIGTLFLVLRPIFSGSGDFNFDVTGNLLLVVSILFGSIYIVGSKRLYSTYSPLTITAFSFLISAIAFLPFSLVETFHYPFWYSHLSLPAIAAIVFSGIFASFVAYLLFDWGLLRVPVHIVSTLGYLTPIVSIGIGALFLKEKLDSLFFLSGVIILLGVYLSTLNKAHHHLNKHRRG